MTDRAVIEGELRGFLFGEGCVQINRQKRPKEHLYTYAVRITVSQRVDNIETLYWLRTHFGGRVIGLKKCPVRVSKPGAWTAAWQLAGRAQVECVLRILLAGTMPSTKRREAELALDFLASIKRRIPGVGNKLCYTQKEREQRARIYGEFRTLRAANRTQAVNYTGGVRP